LKTHLRETGSIIVAAVVALVCFAVPALGKNVHTVASAPYCSPSAPHVNPHPNCMFRPWAEPKQAQKFNGTATVVKAPTRVGKTFNYEFTVTLHYSVPYQDKPICAASGGQPSSFPCAVQPYDEYSQPNVGFQTIGTYIPGMKTLAGSPASAEPHQKCPQVNGTCTETFEFNAYSTWGHFVFVIGMGLGYYVPFAWTGNDLGGAGFETSISLTFPKLKGSSPVNSNPS
jgi:hypothetical protein